MKRLFYNFLKNKYFFLWIFFFILVLYFIFTPLLNLKVEYMERQKITDILYIFYVFVSPLSFAQMSFISCFVLDICYLAVLLYIIVNFVNHFFVDSVSTTLTRIKRKIWIQNVIKANLSFSVLVSVGYIIIFLILCLMNQYDLNLNLNCYILIGYKIGITIIVPLSYLLAFLKTKNSFLSLILSGIIYIFLEILVGFTLIESTLAFQYPIALYFLLVTIYVSLCLYIRKIFERSDF